MFKYAISHIDFTFIPSANLLTIGFQIELKIIERNLNPVEKKTSGISLSFDSQLYRFLPKKPV